MKIKSIFFSLMILIWACSQTPEKIRLNDPNPTKFVFDVNENSLRKAIVMALENSRYREMMLCYDGSRYRPLDTLRLLSQPGNEADFYLTPSDLTIGKSYLYDLDYRVSFHLHLRSIDNNHTEVSVVAIKPRVIVGKEFLPSPPHFVRKVKYHNVEPSTIEEYEILLRIGDALGEQGMPALKKP